MERVACCEIWSSHSSGYLGRQNSSSVVFVAEVGLQFIVEIVHQKIPLQYQTSFFFQIENEVHYYVSVQINFINLY
jgi:hypothetical protein